MSGWIVLVLGVIGAVCALLASMGFRGRENVVGIDLGTTYSVIGVRQGDKVVIIPDADGRKLTPSMVSFLPGGKTLVGVRARNHIVEDPAHTIFNAKRFMGYRLSDEAVQHEAKNYDFGFQDYVDGDGRTEVCFELNVSKHPKCVSPTVVGSYVVKHLLDIARKYLGHNQISAAVIAVPADFNPRQKEATAEAFKAAGLRVARVLEEPTAAAIAYGLHKDTSVNYVLVFDFGGGTLDVSLLYIYREAVQVIDTDGDSQLGGADIDQALSEYLRTKFGEKLGEDLPRTENDVHEEDNGIIPCTTVGVLMIAERLKRDLSSVTIGQASCEVHHTTAKAKDGTILEIEVTREEFETICSTLLERTMKPITRALEQNNMSPESVDEVVLVGGSSRIPWIRQRLTTMFNRPPQTDIDPDIAVAYGAARVVD